MTWPPVALPRHCSPPSASLYKHQIAMPKANHNAAKGMSASRDAVEHCERAYGARLQRCLQVCQSGHQHHWVKR